MLIQVLLIAALTPLNAFANGVTAMGPVGDALQLVLVVGDAKLPGQKSDWNVTTGQLTRYERSAPGSKWVAQGPATIIVFGKMGLAWGRGLHGENLGDGGADKREGDFRSVAGVFQLTRSFGFAAQPPGAQPLGTKIDNGVYTQLLVDTQCVEDQNSTSYNEIVDRRTAGKIDWKGNDRMGDPKKRGALFHWGLVVGHNSKHVKGAGSCVFIHVWPAPKQGTAGCTAGADSDIEDLVGWVHPGKSAVMVQLPAGEYLKYRDQWGIP